MDQHNLRTLLRLSLTTVVLCSGASLAWGQNANGPTSCVVHGKTYDNCPPGLLKQAKREAARAHQRAPKAVNLRLAGVSPATTGASPLAAGITPAAVMAPGTTPDYFGVGHYANSPLPQINASGGIVAGTGMRKFVDALPGLCAVTGATPTLGQCLPLATPDTTVPAFAGSDFYRIGLKEYSLKLHSDLPGPTTLRGYTDLVLDSSGNTHQYLGPVILATRNRPVRVLFQDMLTTNLNVPVDTTYMGAGAVSDGTNSALASQKRATLHLHGGTSPWISDGTTHQWITPAGDTVPNALGFAKGYSFQNVPDMVGPGKLIPNPTLTDGLATFYWSNQQSGRLMFYHDHAYGITRLAVYNGVAAGYLLVDPTQESMLATATAPGTIVTDPNTGAIVTADLTHVYPLVIQDKSFVPDSGVAGGQLAAQDPTWDTTLWGGAGNLWFPHVYTPNQNPADISGANGFGRWDWGPWFWPPQNPGSLQLQAYLCSSIATPPGGWAFPPLMCPGVPDPTQAAPANSPSGTPESFMDTPVVNGTAYPTLSVSPAAYRFQVLNAANDRGLNLGLYVAEPVTLSPIITNPGNNYLLPTVTIGGTGCTGGVAIAQTDNGTFNGVPFTNGIVSITIVTQPTAPCTNPTITIADTAPGVGAGATASAVMAVNAEVKMMPAVQAIARPTFPNCSRSLAPPMWGGGQVTALFDATGNPLYGTGLPTGGTGPACWPLYNSLYGFTAAPMGERGQVSWGNSDGREGGVPDPSTAGPPIIQIGAEGGLLPQVAVIPSTPVSYDYNKRSITVLNVLNHGLLIGPAERADIIVDFSAFAGKTLLLYNDAPVPMPAEDPRIDYYANDLDYSATGGAPGTVAGYGPNIRTVMQIQVAASGPGNTVPFSLPALMNATTGVPAIFAATQDAVIIPEPAYPVGHGNGPPTYLPIQATSMVGFLGGPIGGVTVTSGGSGYTAAPTVSFAGGGGTGAAATAALTPTAVGTLTLVSGGSGYTTAPTVQFTGGGGTGAVGTAVLAPRRVASVTITNGGSNYLTAPAVSFTGGGGTGAAGTAVLGKSVASVTVTNGGSGYTTRPTVSFSGGGGSGAAGTATISGGRVTAVTVTNGGSGYTSAPTVQFTGGGGTGAAATAVLSARGSVKSVTITNAGNNYTSPPAVGFTGGGGTGAAGTAVLTAVPVASLILNSGGSGYTSAPTVTIVRVGPCGGQVCTNATATARLAPTSVASVTVTNGGSGYTSAPTVTFSAPPSGSTATGVATAPANPVLPKAIQELFTLDYGRMNSTLGVELPFSNFLTQTTIPYAYVDPPTEIYKDGETQIWKITHNGVDTHFIHVHLFTAQVINRVGWDGAIKPPDPNELGFKDTIRMNPLEDIIIALRPIKPTLPWPVPNSYRVMDTTQPVGASLPNEFTNVDPTNQPAVVTNQPINFGWEYVWHCHILGHEENDMMRATVMAVGPVVPNVPTGSVSGTGNNQTITLNLSATAVANTAVPSGFTVQRATSPAGPWTTRGSVAATLNGVTATATFPDTPVARGTTYYYQAIANNVVGYTQTYAPPAAGYPHPSADSAPSATSSPITTNP